MSFNDMEKSELVEVAEMFAVDIRSNMTKPQILKALENDGVDWDQYAVLTQKVAEAPVELALVDEASLEPTVAVVEIVEEAPEEDYVVVKMTRENRSYQIGQYKFTRDHPYVLVREQDADVMFERMEGFRPATPKELREFYGK